MASMLSLKTPAFSRLKAQKWLMKCKPEGGTFVSKHQNWTVKNHNLTVEEEREEEKEAVFLTLSHSLKIIELTSFVYKVYKSK